MRVETLRRWPVSMSAVLLGFVLAVALNQSIPFARAQSQPLDRDTAQMRWATRPFQSYRLLLRVDGFCTRDVEIRAEQIIPHGVGKPCMAPVQRIDDLFRIISSMPVEQPRLTSYMSANGMQCVERAAWHAEYDPVWGVPQRVELVAGTLMPWERPQIWLQILGKAHVPDCPLQQTVMRIEIVDFTPLP